MDFCVNSLKFSFSDSFILQSSSTNLSTNLLGQPRNRSLRIQSSIFVVWELRDYNKMLEKTGIKIIDFDDFVFCTTESKSITFNTALFLEGYSLQQRNPQIQEDFLPSEASVSPPNKLNQNPFRFGVILFFDKDIVRIIGRDCEDSYFIFCEKY